MSGWYTGYFLPTSMIAGGAKLKCHVAEILFRF